MAQPGVTQAPSLPALLLDLLFGYLRWTQWVPMVLAWGVAGFLIGGALFAHWALGVDELDKQAQADYFDSPAFQVAVDGLHWLDETVLEDARDVNGEVDWEAVILRAWSALALVGFVLSLLAGALGYRARPRGLGKKMRLAAVASLVPGLLFCGAMLAFGERFEPGSSWPEKVMMAGLGGLFLSVVVLMASAWSVLATTVIGWVGDLARGAVVEGLGGGGKPAA